MRNLCPFPPSKGSVVLFARAFLQYGKPCLSSRSFRLLARCCLLWTHLLAALLFVLPVMGQSGGSWQESYSLVGDVSELDEAEYETLEALSASPFPLCRATREQLEQLPFLSDEQVEEICLYLYRYGALRSWGELLLLPSVGMPCARLLRHFVTLCDDGQVSESPSFGHRMMVGAAVPLYRRRGDEEGYLGYPVSHWLRYDLCRGKTLRGAFVASQDAGEPFFGPHNRMGYDHYGGYVQGFTEGCVDKWVVGRYRLRLGMGLAVNNYFRLGRYASFSQYLSTSDRLGGCASRNDLNALQGAAAQISLSPSIMLFPFLSFRSVDATLSEDGTVSTLLYSGYHRTLSELERKNDVTRWDGGLKVRLRKGRSHVGLSAVGTSFSRRLEPPANSLARRHDLRGRNFGVLGMDYGLCLGAVEFFGEGTVGNHGALATLNTMHWRIVPTFRLRALQRFYSYRYHAPLASSFSYGQRPRNESGGCVGMLWEPSTRFRIDVMGDYARFAWPVHRCSRPSHALSMQLLADYLHGDVQAQVRHRYVRRYYDEARIKGISASPSHHSRIWVKYEKSSFSSHLQFDHTFSKLSSQHGNVLSQRLGYENRRLRGQFFFSYFHTPSSGERVYVYQPDIRHRFSFMGLGGEGIGWGVLAAMNLWKHMRAEAQLSTTNYFDRAHISSGLSQISHSHKTDLHLQLIYRF